MSSSCSINYAEWGVETYEKRIAPVIQSSFKEISPDINSGAWLNTCNPGPLSTNRYRLFPGSLFLLWVEALQPDADKTGSEFAAAAIELLHNASLIHDDILDNHVIRKGQPTLLSMYGSSIGLLGGDGLFAAAISMLAQLPASKINGVLNRLGNAVENVVFGQILDESEQWARVSSNMQFDHWLKVCKGKLSLGNVAGTLAAFWVGKGSMEKDIEMLLDDFSVVSQIINDFGDLFNFSGYHAIAPSLRMTAEESLRKPTLPLIWSKCNNASKININALHSLVQKAHDEINHRKDIAIQRLALLPITKDERINTILSSFFNTPSMPI
ncbi:MAG: polyprenyl synthetase family protein [Bacteroidota bacterium]|nr:polyprenyl synthetase family protein [Bacteroidota bacterium]